MRTSIRRGLCALALTGGLSVAGLALASTAQAATGDATNVPGASTSGAEGTGSGNQTSPGAGAPVEASGNQVTVLGDGNSSAGRVGTGGAGDGAGPGDDGNNAAPDPNQSGSGGPNDGSGGAGNGTGDNSANSPDSADDTVAGAQADRSAGPSRSGTREVAGVSAGTTGPVDGAASVLPSTGTPFGAATLGGAVLLLLTGLVLLSRSRCEEVA